ncbi:MAG TPA: hypothetical protein VMU34_19485 [Mycobacterium sp.]|nr:hypothetical protein [Mycobacterium sp.]
MTQHRHEHRRPVTLPLVAALAAVAAMGALTVTMSGYHPGGGSTTVTIADPTTRTPPPTAPAVPSATPTMKAPPFSGGWEGGGPFHGGGWPS